jgi:hypothetical protein
VVGGDDIFAAASWHLLLLRLAGRVSDDVSARSRNLLAQGRTADLGTYVAAAVISQEVPLSQVEFDFLANVMDATADTKLPLGGIEISDVETPLRYGFTVALPDDTTAFADAPGADEAAIETTSQLAGPRGLWRAWRLPSEGTTGRNARRVYVVEADESANLVRITGDIQHALAAVGERHPQVEVYPTGTELQTYQRFARSHGQLLWSRTPDPGMRIAVLFDEVDPTQGPRFRPDHPTIDGDELSKLLFYLRRGEPLLLTTARMRDVIDPARGDAVPMSFRTDGTWIWSDATTYYLDAYQLMPDPQLAAHVRALGYNPPTIDDVARHRAMSTLKQPVTDEPAWAFP